MNEESNKLPIKLPDETAQLMTLRQVDTMYILVFSDYSVVVLRTEPDYEILQGIIVRLKMETPVVLKWVLDNLSVMQPDIPRNFLGG